MRKRVGEYLVEKEVLSPAQVEEILAYGRKSGLRFGEAGLKLRLLTPATLARVFGTAKADFFYLDPMYFPEVTKSLLPVEAILRLGVLPLGFKTEWSFFRSKRGLNAGFLDPDRAGAAAELLVYVRDKLGRRDIEAIRPFLIIPDQFNRILECCYGVKREEGD